jgi:excinuclease UvrABC nuclease subunit
MAPNYRQIMAIRKANEDKIRKLCPTASDKSGIYVFWRIDENGFKYAYVGQAKNLLKRLAEHLAGYQHIDCSIKKHKFYDEETILMATMWR